MNTKPKLMLISPKLHQGGFERVCITTARLLKPYFDVTIVIFDNSNIAYDIEGLQIENLNLGVRKGKFAKLLNMFRRAARVKQLKKKWKPKITYSFGPTANLVNTFSRTKDTKVWLGIRNYTDVEETLKMRMFTKKADLIVCCAKEIEHAIKVKYKYNKLTTLYNLFDTEAIKKDALKKEIQLPWNSPTDQIIISMGRDDDQKCFWHMMKVFALVHQENPNAKLVLMGAGSFDLYRQMADEFKITGDIYFAGVQKEPYPYLQRGQIYLITSKNEGFPNALVEGMALGLAAVSTNCLTGPAEILMSGAKDEEAVESTTIDSMFDACRQKGEPEVIYGTSGILVPVMGKERNLNTMEFEKSEKEMAAVLLKLLSDEELLHKYQEAAGKRAQDFTYEAYVTEFLKLVGTQDK